ncbi:hypothetical protein PMAYCL1PPCAC_10076 [Pristionchus mayeri]|uniref:Uncharacterized protein n=1 Tax=Pristionchus mayeri TaxID=1317129 RepID=A0AAN4ZIU6_9BILA|nr:hypothetical protein PMAYCL1PPCAC_10076 [Pristionchus mayeri]
MMEVALQQMAAAVAASNANNLKSEAIPITRMLGSDIEMSTTPPRNESGSFEELQFSATSLSTPTLQHPPVLQTQQSRQAQAAIDFEKEIGTLESAIRTQKVSSMNAKTAITFDQLRLVHAIGKSLGNGKDAFYDRICRAADIQRASLKNRLKQNKEKFIQKSIADFPPSILELIKRHPPPPKYAQYSLATPLQPEKPPEPTPLDFFSNAFDQSISNLTTPVGNAFLPQGGMTYAFVKPEIIEASEPVLSQEDKELQERDKIPPQRMMQLLQLGFSFEDMKIVNDMYHSYAEMARRENVSNIREQFSNFLSTSIPERLKLIGIAYNMLEMGYTSTAIAPHLVAERRKRAPSELSGGDDSNQGDISVKRQCLDDIEERS